MTRLHDDHAAPVDPGLGGDDELAFADREVRGARAQFGLTTLFLLACRAIGGPKTDVLITLGVIADLVLAVRLIVCLDDRRQRAIDLIACGRTTCDAPVIDRIRGELLGRRRVRIADLLETALTDSRFYVGRAGADDGEAPALAGLGAEAEQIIALLRGDGVRSAQAVALAGRIVCDPSAPLASRHDAVALRQELGRIRYLLQESRAVTPPRFSER